MKFLNKILFVFFVVIPISLSYFQVSASSCLSLLKNSQVPVLRVDPSIKDAADAFGRFGGIGIKNMGLGDLLKVLEDGVTTPQVMAGDFLTQSRVGRVMPPFQSETPYRWSSLLTATVVSGGFEIEQTLLVTQ